MLSWQLQSMEDILHFLRDSLDLHFGVYLVPVMGIDASLFICETFQWELCRCQLILIQDNCFYVHPMFPCRWVRASDEFLGNLETSRSLDHLKKVDEVYIFPQALHVKIVSSICL